MTGPRDWRTDPTPAEIAEGIAATWRDIRERENAPELKPVRVRAETEDPSWYTVEDR